MDAPIRVVVGNPPYNVGQQNENDQNKNRKYTASGGVDERVAKTYTKDSSATLRNKLSRSLCQGIPMGRATESGTTELSVS